MLRLVTSISLALLLIPAAACRQNNSVESAPPVASATTTPLQQAPPGNVTASSTAERTPDEVVTEERPPAAGDAQAAVAVIRDYYDAIASRDFARAYGAWGSSGPRGQSLQAFAAGFDDTKSVRATTGSPSQIGAAAGSRYIDVPVTIVATTVGGDTRNFGGTYTLRRAVVDGASTADRRWHIDHASIRRLD